MIMKTILHCDLNNFFASVECRENPQLRDKPVAVCGSVEERKGIVLAKNELAKSFGVKTGEPWWQAKRKCQGLVSVPPHYSSYMNASAEAFEIYTRFTDMIEPFGIDECWLDVTGSGLLFGTGEEIAYKIKETIKSELGLTISVGVSFNKAFAKLGSDLKKPDAVTVISPENFHEKLWRLPVENLLGAGRATCMKLKRYGVRTIGDLAQCSEDFISRILGVSGEALRIAALGAGSDSVCRQDFKREVKSIGNSTTCVRDLNSNKEVWEVLLELSRSVCQRLRKEGKAACGIQVSVKTSDLEVREFQAQTEFEIRSSLELARKGFELFCERFKWELPVRAVGIRAFSLTNASDFCQQSLLDDTARLLRKEKAEEAIDALEERFGKDIVLPLSAMKQIPIPDQKNKSGFFH